MKQNWINVWSNLIQSIKLSFSEDTHLLNDPVDNDNNLNDESVMKNYANGFIAGIGKILRAENGGIPTLYKHSLEMPDSRFSKILHSLIAWFYCDINLKLKSKLEKTENYWINSVLNLKTSN